MKFFGAVSHIHQSDKFQVLKCKLNIRLTKFHRSIKFHENSFSSYFPDYFTYTFTPHWNTRQNITIIKNNILRLLFFVITSPYKILATNNNYFNFTLRCSFLRHRSLFFDQAQKLVHQTIKSLDMIDLLALLNVDVVVISFDHGLTIELIILLFRSSIVLLWYTNRHSSCHYALFLTTKQLWMIFIGFMFFINFRSKPNRYYKKEKYIHNDLFCTSARYSSFTSYITQNAQANLLTLL